MAGASKRAARRKNQSNRPAGLPRRAALPPKNRPVSSAHRDALVQKLKWSKAAHAAVNRAKRLLK